MRPNELINRRTVFQTAIVLVFIILLSQLFYLQVLREDFKKFADSNAFLNRTIYPSRGMIYDRNGKLLVYNRPAYDIIVIMNEIEPFDTLDFCHTIHITKEQYINRIKELKDRRKNPGYSSYTQQILYTQVSAEEYGILQEKLYKFPGFYVQSRTIREYGDSIGAHILGDIGEVNKRDIENDNYYVSGDYSGRSGVEKSYEEVLRGEKGVEIMLRDAHGRLKGRYENGIHDEDAHAGKDIHLSIDSELQRYGELLMKNKTGSIVAIDPETGGILCLVSTPTYNPNLLIGRHRGKNHVELSKDPAKPLFNRALMAQYPPGSTFKPAQSLVFLQEGAITPSTAFYCWGKGGRPACHPHPSPISLIPALATSCNVFPYFALRIVFGNKTKYPTIQDAMNSWRDYMVSMGFGYALGVDLPGEKRGLIPNSRFYDKIYGPNGWKYNTIYSISIGQGEVNLTPIQIANLAAQISNRGWYYPPHIVKEVEEGQLDSIYTHKKHTLIDSKNYEAIIQGMHGAVTEGTCRGAQIDSINVCGKTGTAQNRGEDHSIFMGFAPMEKARIAISVYVENGGFGARWAVPIGGLMMEKYLKGSIPENRKWVEEKMINGIVKTYGF